jgi:hypothetical protein
MCGISLQETYNETMRTFKFRVWDKVRSNFLNNIIKDVIIRRYLLYLFFIIFDLKFKYYNPSRQIE